MKRGAFIVFSLGILVVLALVSPNLSGLAQKKPAPKAKAAAEAPPPQEWLAINSVRIKPDMVTEYRNFVINEAIPALKKGGVKSREAFTTAVFGESYEYTYVSTIENLAQYDGPSPLVKALGEAGAQAFGEKARRFIVSSRTVAVQTRPDLSHVGQMASAPKLAVINTVRIVPGRNAAFENILKMDVIPAIKKTEVVGYFVSQTVLGGDPNEYVTVALMDNFAQIGKGSPLMRGLGGPEAYNRFLLKATGIIQHQERAVVRYVPEMSITEAPPGR